MVVWFWKYWKKRYWTLLTFLFHVSYIKPYRKSWEQILHKSFLYFSRIWWCFVYLFSLFELNFCWIHVFFMLHLWYYIFLDNLFSWDNKELVKKFFIDIRTLKATKVRGLLGVFSFLIYLFILKVRNIYVTIQHLKEVQEDNHDPEGKFWCREKYRQA